METATWVIAAAGMLNVIVLAVYAWFTLGMWRETQRSALRTEDLARQSRDALKLQTLVTILNGEHPVLEAADVPRKWSALWGTKGDEVRALLGRVFLPYGKKSRKTYWTRLRADS